jgi:hypothetical protein
MSGGARKGRPKKLTAYLIHWVDIEGDAGWGEGAEELPTVVTIGFLHARPRKKDRVPFWKFKDSQIEEEPGGVVSIPAACVVKMEKLGTFPVVHRE